MTYPLSCMEGLASTGKVFFFFNVCFLQFWHLFRARPDPPFPLQEDRRQSVSRQPSFTYSEWTEDKNEDDFLDLDPVPETPVFDCVMDIKVETDPTTLTVKSVGLQERQGRYNEPRECWVPDFLGLALCLVGSFIIFMNVIFKCGFEAKLYYLSVFSPFLNIKHVNKKPCSFQVALNRSYAEVSLLSLVRG